MKWRSLEESSPETDVRPLREILAERKELIAKYVPAETQAVHARAVAELKQKRLAANILPVGAKIPEFQLQDHDGKTVSSSDLLAKGRLVLCFIRGRWCPFCVAQMEAMNLILPEIEQAGATLARDFSADGEAIILHARSAQAALSAALRCRQQSRAAVRPDLPRPRRTASGLSTRLRQSALREWRRQLGVADSCDLHHRPRRDGALRFRERGLHGAAGTGGHRACPGHTDRGA